MFDRVIGRLEDVHHYDGYIMARCPFHDDSTPSLSVFEDGWFRCYGCGKVGTHKQLSDATYGFKSSQSSIPVQRTSWGLPDIPKSLIDLENLVESSHKLLLQHNDTLAWYLQLRGVEDRIETCRLGWFNGWYVIPIYTDEDNFSGIVMRAGKHIEKATGLRYYMPPNQPPKLYCPEWPLIYKSDRVFVVFGMFDAIALSHLRLPTVTTTSGAQTFNARWLDSFRRPVYILADMGEEAQAHKLSKELGWRGKVITLNYPDDIKDPAGFIETGKEKDLLNQIWRYTKHDS